MNVRKIAYLFLFTLLVSAAAYASDEPSESPTSQTASVDNYGEGVGKKLGRGISNVAFGWLELPKGIEEVGDNNNWIAGVTWGPIYGLGKAVTRTVAGVYETATFPVAVPRDFEPIVKPDFPLNDSR